MASTRVLDGSMVPETKECQSLARNGKEHPRTLELALSSTFLQRLGWSESQWKTAVCISMSLGPGEDKAQPRQSDSRCPLGVRVVGIYTPD